jgi:uncharacterized protein (TIGR03083 family)
MTRAAIDALSADREALLNLCDGLPDADWKLDSGCPGWSVQDVVAHLGAGFWVLVDSSALPGTGGLPTERAQDVYVEARRSWSTERVVDDYRNVSATAIEQLTGLDGQDFEVPLGDLGTYHISLIANAFAFDHYTHIREDLFEPRGPLAGPPPPSDEVRLEATLDWIAAALPQQNRGVIASLGGVIEVRLEGPAGRLLTLGSGERVASISGTVPSFVRWVTQRGDWDGLGLAASGDSAAVAMARQIHVF